MAVELATAYISVIPSAKGFEANLARELAPTSFVAGAEGKKAGQALGGSLTQGFAASGFVSRFKTETASLGKSLQSSLSGFGVAGGIGGALLTKSSIDAASDLAESQSKVNVVFEAGAPIVQKWSDTTTTGLGVSKQAALEAAGTFGNFLISMGLARKQSQEMSIDLVTLASDLASFNNTSPDDALLALRSGLAGEVEPLRRYGVSLSAARVEAEGMAEGINKTSAEMSPAERAQLSYQIILKDTALAQGDFARTSGGLANQQRILSARLKDAEAELGGFLIPLLLTGEKAAVGLGHGLGVVNKATGGWAGTLGGAALVGGTVFVTVKKLTDVGGRLVSVFTGQAAATTTLTAAQATNAGVATADAVAQDGLATSSTAAAVAMEGEAASAGFLQTSMTGLAPVLAAVAIGFLGGKKAGDEINDLITGAPPKVDALTASLLNLEKGQKGAFDFSKFGDDFRGQVNFGGKAGPLETAKDLVGAFTKNAHQAKADIGPLNEALKSILQTEGVDKATRAYGLFVQGLQAQGVEIGTITGNFAPFQAALDLANAKETDLGDTTKGLTNDFQGLTDGFAKEVATLGIADQLDAAKDAIDDLNELKLDARGEGEKSIAAARSEKNAVESLSDAYDAQSHAVTSVAEARAKLAEFDSPTDTRIRSLELQNIQSRVVTTPEEARQKEIDLLKFDEDNKDKRADLQRQVKSAEDGVRAATERVGDAQEAVSAASEARRQVQVDAADAIAGAERKAEGAILAAGKAITDADVAGQLGKGNAQLDIYVTLLDGLSRQLDPNSPLTKNLDTFLGKLDHSLQVGTPLGPFGPVGPGGLVTAPDNLRPAPPAGPVGPSPSAANGRPLVNQVNHFHGADQPTIRELDTVNRKSAIRLANAGLR